MWGLFKKIAHLIKKSLQYVWNGPTQNEFVFHNKTLHCKDLLWNTNLYFWGD